jgi:hypothetical protein
VFGSDRDKEVQQPPNACIDAFGISRNYASSGFIQTKNAAAKEN